MKIENMILAFLILILKTSILGIASQQYTWNIF